MQRKNNRYSWLIATIDSLNDDLSLPWDAYPCLDWPWGTDAFGYGLFRTPTELDGGKTTKASRFAFQRVHGPLLPGEWALHRCDRPVCFRPTHLFRGDRIKNMEDMVAKGRGRNRSREEHNLAKLNWEKVYRAREMYYKEGKTIMQIAEHFGLVFSSMRSAIVGETWKPK